MMPLTYLILVHILTYLLWPLSPQIVGAQVEAPTNFPPGISITLGTFENWSTEIKVTNLWIATPATPNDVVTLANWAYQNNYTLRARGFMHSWSPLTVTSANNKTNVVLVDTTVNLTQMKMTTSPVPSTHAATVQTGTSMLNLLTFLEKNACGVVSSPAPGDITVGGALAIGGHGSAIPLDGTEIPGTFGTLSNLIISLTAVVWNSTSNAYILQTFQRSNVDTKAFLVHLGRTFITEVTIMVIANYNLRCQSFTNIGSDELFADPENITSSTQTFVSFLQQTGRVEAILFPFTTYPWLKVWTNSSNKPIESREVFSPFNYPFSDIVPEIVSTLVANITIDASLTPELGPTQLLVVEAGLLTTLSSDIWGKSKNLLLYLKPTTIIEQANGYAILTTLAYVQQVISSSVTYYNNMVKSYADQGLYPFNGAMEIRCTAVEQQGITPNSEPPALSAARPVNNQSNYNVVVWVDILGLPNTPGINEAYSQYESFLFNTFNGTYATVRPEWSKGWAYTAQSGWTNSTIYANFVPASFPATSSTNGWNWTVSTLNKYDPNYIFTNEFLKEFLQTVSNP